MTRGAARVSEAHARLTRLTDLTGRVAARFPARFRIDPADRCAVTVLNNHGGDLITVSLRVLPTQGVIEHALRHEWFARYPQGAIMTGQHPARFGCSARVFLNPSDVSAMTYHVEGKDTTFEAVAEAILNALQHHS